MVPLHRERPLAVENVRIDRDETPSSPRGDPSRRRTGKHPTGGGILAAAGWPLAGVDVGESESEGSRNQASQAEMSMTKGSARRWPARARRRR